VKQARGPHARIFNIGLLVESILPPFHFEFRSAQGHHLCAKNLLFLADSFKRPLVILLVYEPTTVGILLNPATRLRVMCLTPVTDSTLAMPVSSWCVFCHYLFLNTYIG